MRLVRRAAKDALAVAALAVAIACPSYAMGADVVHVVAKGQTLGRIAKRYGTTVEAIRKTNNLKPGQRIHPGLSLVIPEKGKAPDAVKRGAPVRGRGHEARGRTGEPRAAPARASRRPAHEDDAEEHEARGPKAPDRAGAAVGKVAAVTRADRRGELAAARTRGDKKGASARKLEGAGARAGRAADYAAKPRFPGRVRFIRASERVDVQVLGRRGQLMPACLPVVSRVLRHDASQARVPIDPRLATLFGMVSNHFGGRPLHVVSGYRPHSPYQYTPHSNHNLGRAVDFSVEGVPNSVLRDYLRTLHGVGVGFYPNSTFVHLDVRTTKAYWVDVSGPGEAPRYTQGGSAGLASHAPPGSDDTRNGPSHADEVSKETDASAEGESKDAQGTGHIEPSPHDTEPGASP